MPASDKDLETIQRALQDASPTRAAYFDDPDVDRVLGIVTSLAGEVAVTAERLDTLERVLADKGMVNTDELRNYQPDDGVLAERNAWHQAFVARLFRVLSQEFESLRKKR